MPFFRKSKSMIKLRKKKEKLTAKEMRQQCDELEALLDDIKMQQTLMH